MTEPIIVLITAASQNEAGAIAKVLVEEHLAACVNIVPQVRSLFFWEGKTQEAAEALLVCKSRKSLFDALIRRVKGIHSYSVPEIIALPIMAGAPEYLSWLEQSTEG